MKQVFKASLVAALVSTAMSAQAGISVVDNDQGKFAIGGNVELNFNYQSLEADDDSNFNQDGRVLIEFAGEKYAPNDHYVAVKAQPLFESTGNIAMDDAYFEFGKKEGWAVKAGRFEAYDLFPVGLDVFLEHSGDTSNSLISDNAPYVYNAKEARGRGSDGQIMYFQTFGDLYVEVNAMLGDRSGLYDGEYHGQTVSSKDAVEIRPVVAYQMGDFRVAAGLEKNLVSNSVVAGEGTSDEVDLSDRIGYGLTGNWTSGDWSVNANVAYMDGVDETNKSYGVNALWKDAGIGYVYADNEYTNDEMTAIRIGDAQVSTVYASYRFNDVIDVKDFSVLLGAYYTTVESNITTGEDFNEDADKGARVRLFYAF